MKRASLNVLVALAFALVAASVLMTVKMHEDTLANGRIVLLELAPVDPRSLMQGDYMALRFAVDRELPPSQRSRPGDPAASPPPEYAHIKLDDKGRGSLVGVGDLIDDGDRMVSMRIRARDSGLTVGTDAFFFQEGTGKDFESARWGEFRVTAQGDRLLTHLRDANLQRLGASKPFQDIPDLEP